MDMGWATCIFYTVIPFFQKAYLTLTSQQCGPGWNPGVDDGVQFVVGSLPCSERFFSGYFGSPLSFKTNTSKFQFDLERTDTFQRVLNNSQVFCGSRRFLLPDREKRKRFTQWIVLSIDGTTAAWFLNALHFFFEETTARNRPEFGCYVRVIGLKRGVMWFIPLVNKSHNHELKADKRLFTLARIPQGMQKYIDEKCLYCSSFFCFLTLHAGTGGIHRFLGFLIMLVFQSRISN